MTYEEAKQVIEYFRSEGRTDDEIVATFYLMFQDDKLNLEELKNLVGLVGYELTEDFLNKSAKEQKHIFVDDYDPLSDVIDELYNLCADQDITEKQLEDVLKILKRKFNKNYLERFKIKKERTNKE